MKTINYLVYIIMSSNMLIAGGNLLPNPSFEKGGKQPQGWVVWGGKKNEAAWSDKQSKSGRKSLSVSTAAKKDGCRWIMEEAVKVTPGVEYELTGWIKTLNAKGNCTISISWYSKKGWLSSKRALLINKTHDWRLLTLRVKAPAEAVCAKIYVGKIKSGAGECWFDDLSFRQIGGNVEKNGNSATLTWSKKLESPAPVITPATNPNERSISGWQKLNPQDCLGLSEKSGTLVIKDTFGNYTGWLSPMEKVVAGKKYNFQTDIFRNKSYNVYMGIIWRDAKNKIIAVSLSKVEPELQKWRQATISAVAPAGANKAGFIVLQRRSSGETSIKNPITSYK